MPETAPTPDESEQALRASLEDADARLLVVVAHHLDGLSNYLGRGVQAIEALQTFASGTTTTTRRQAVALADVHERAESIALRLNAIIGDIRATRRDFMKGINS